MAGLQSSNIYSGNTQPTPAPKSGQSKSSVDYTEYAQFMEKKQIEEYIKKVKSEIKISEDETESTSIASVTTNINLSNENISKSNLYQAPRAESNSSYKGESTPWITVEKSKTENNSTDQTSKESSGEEDANSSESESTNANQKRWESQSRTIEAGNIVSNLVNETISPPSTSVSFKRKTNTNSTNARNFRKKVE
jgi:hypothetical protein